MKKHSKRSLFLAVVLAVSLVGCGSASSMDKLENTYSDKNAAGYSAAPQQMDAEAAPNADAGVNTSAAPAPMDGQKLIRTVQMSVESKDFDTAAAALLKKCSELGGYVSNREVWGSEQSTSTRQASFEVRIPAAKCDEFLLDAQSIGNVTSSAEQLEDISLQYADTAARIESLETEQARLNELMAQASSLEDIIKLEERLSDVRAELASYEQTRRIYDNQVDYATVTIELYEVKNLTVTKPGFADDLKGAFTGSIETLLSFGKGAVLLLVYWWWLWLIVAAAICFLIKTRKKHRVKKTTKTEKDPGKNSDLPKMPLE